MPTRPTSPMSMGTNGAGGSLEGDTAPGDSGGPLFEYDFTDSQFVITGVHSFGSDNTLARYGDIGVDTQVQAYSTFIAGAVPEPVSFGIFFGIGGILALPHIGFGRRMIRPVSDIPEARKSSTFAVRAALRFHKEA